MRTSTCLLQISLKRGKHLLQNFKGTGGPKIGRGGGGTSEVWPKEMGHPREVWEAKAYMYLLFVGTKYNKISDLPNYH